MWAFQRCIAGLQRMKTHGERDHSRYKKIVNFRLRRAPRAACNRAFLWEFSKVLKSPHKKFAFFVCTNGPPWRGPLGLCASKKGRKKSIRNWPKQPGGPVVDTREMFFNSARQPVSAFQPAPHGTGRRHRHSHLRELATAMCMANWHAAPAHKYKLRMRGYPPWRQGRSLSTLRYDGP